MPQHDSPTQEDHTEQAAQNTGSSAGDILMVAGLGALAVFTAAVAVAKDRPAMIDSLVDKFECKVGQLIDNMTPSDQGFPQKENDPRMQRRCE